MVVISVNRAQHAVAAYLWCRLANIPMVLSMTALADLTIVADGEYVLPCAMMEPWCRHPLQQDAVERTERGRLADTAVRHILLYCSLSQAARVGPPTGSAELCRKAENAKDVCSRYAASVESEWVDMLCAMNYDEGGVAVLVDDTEDTRNDAAVALALADDQPVVATHPTDIDAEIAKMLADEDNNALAAQLAADAEYARSLTQSQ